VFDSAYGNTKAIAEEIGKQFTPETTAVMSVSMMDKVDISQVDLLVVGSPTYGGRPMESIKKFLTSIPENSLSGKKVAAFDTRFQINDQGFGLRLLMKIIGYAAPKMEKTLVQKGGEAAVEATGFIVKDKKGPLKEGELDLAKAWARHLASV
jgi:flavodoxin